MPYNPGMWNRRMGPGVVHPMHPRHP